MMKTSISENTIQPGTALLNQRVTREMVHARTVELAKFAGRDSHQIKQVDYEKAKRELTGETDFDLQQAALNW